MFSGIGGLCYIGSMANKYTAHPIPPRQELEQLYASGLTQAQVGKHFGVTQKVIYSWFKKLGIKSRVPKNINQDRENTTCIGYSEIDKYAIKVYERQFRGHTNYGDATTINAKELPDFDLLVGGFPCQAFSVAGKRAGFNDTRGTLFFDIARILKEKRPRHLVLENVKGLLSHDKLAKLSRQYLGFSPTWGISLNGRYLTAKTSEFPKTESGSSLSDILEDGCRRTQTIGEVFPITGGNTKLPRETVSTTPSPTQKHAGAESAKVWLIHSTPQPLKEH
jgi:hypothetical protein